MRKLLFIIVLTSLFLSCDIFAETNSATYIYQGRYSADVIYRKENYLIYGSEVFGRVENDLIYVGTARRFCTGWSGRRNVPNL